MTSTRFMLALIPVALAQAVLAQPARAQGTAEQRAACGPDAVRLCASAIPDPGRVAACLAEKRDALGTACRTVLDAAGAARQPRTAETPAGTPAAPAGPAGEAGPSGARSGRVAGRAPRQRGVAAAEARRGARHPAHTAMRSRPGGRVVARRARREDADTAEALYWMRRVTGYTGTIDVSAFERMSDGFRTLVR